MAGEDKMGRSGKIIIISLLALFLLMGLIHLEGFYFDQRDFSGGKEPIWGVSFRRAYAEYLILDPKETALAIFNDLRVSNIRLIIPWNEIEPQEGNFDFSFFDWFVNEASRRGVKIIPNIGKRVAGWPEFHIPDWALKLPEDEFKAQVLNMLATVVNRYKNNSAVEMWQIENEPLFKWRLLSDVEKNYGIKIKVPDPEFLKDEIDLVKRLDSRPVIVTDSGELSDWKESSKVGDYFGTTLYRFLWQRIWGSLGVRLYYGYIPSTTFVSAAFYNTKAKKLNLDINKIFVIELQTEPWIRHSSLLSVTPQEQFKIFGLKQFRNNIEYAKKTGFPRVYLWGVEWLYFQKTQGSSKLWDEAKKLWQ